MKRYLLSAIVALPLCLTPLQASGLTGDTVDVSHLFPNQGTLNSDMGTQVVPTGDFNYVDIYNVVVTDGTITYNSDYGSSWTSATFNGFVVTDETNSLITSVTVDGTTSYAGFSSSDVTFTANQVFVNLQGLGTAGFIQLDVQAGASTPEPATWLMFGTAGIGLAVFRLRGSKSAC